ncbi:MAG: polyprenyl diphosphate synthase [Candidatus Woesearchaeota archaeon]
MHVGIIMDGNRRHARGLGEIAYTGHSKGYETLKRLLEDLSKDDLGIRELTLYAFSCENFRRDEKELEHSFNLFRHALSELQNAEERRPNVKGALRFVGRLDLFPDDIRDAMLKVNETYTEEGVRINFLAAYNGQDEIVDATRRIVKRGLHASDIDRTTIRENSYLPDSQPVDLVIRTGMEDGARLSGFMLYHASYAELVFLEDYWPEFTHAKLKTCIDEFKERNRRFGR